VHVFEIRYLANRMSLLRLCQHPDSPLSAADCMLRLLLAKALNVFKTLIRTSESTAVIAEKGKVTYDKIVELLKRNKDETEVDNFTKILNSTAQARELTVEPPAALTSAKHIVQWVVNFTLNLASVVPDYKARKCLGVRLLMGLNHFITYTMSWKRTLYW
jgi:hypothetical protein